MELGISFFTNPNVTVTSWKLSHCRFLELAAELNYAESYPVKKEINDDEGYDDEGYPVQQVFWRQRKPVLMATSVIYF
jgi:hypothetical protein